MNVNIGHGHPKVAEAVAKQMAEVSYVHPGMITEARGKLGKTLAEITPGSLNRTFFTNGGTEAVEHAMKLARLVHRSPQDHHAIPELPRRHVRCAQCGRRSARFAARQPGRAEHHPRGEPVFLPLPVEQQDAGGMHRERAGAPGARGEVRRPAVHRGDHAGRARAAAAAASNTRRATGKA
jgi:hypothetical protein